MALQFRRGTDAERQQFEFAEGEPVYVTDTGELYIGDGETQGGRRVLSSLSEESDPGLGGNLDLNSNNIIGIGNIAIDGNLSVSGLGQSLDLNGFNIIGQGNIIIDGTINATGDINLGDGVEDNVIVGGQISSPLIPAEDGIYDLGSDSLRWRNSFFEGVEVDGNLTSYSLQTTKIFKIDSEVLYDADTDTLTANTIEGNSLQTTKIFKSDSEILYNADTDTLTANTIEGNFTGSVFSDDSTQIIDSINKSLNLNGMTLFDNVINLDNFNGKLTISNNNDTQRTELEIISNGPDFNYSTIGITDGNASPGSVCTTSRENNSSVQPGDIIYRNIAVANDGTNESISSGIYHYIDPRFTVENSSAPGRISLLTFFSDDGVTMPKGIDIDAEGQVSISHNILTHTARKTLDVNGDGIFTGSLEASGFIGSLFADDSTLLIDAVNGEIIAPIRDISIIGDTGTPISNTDNLSPVEWLEVKVNNNVRYIPLYE